MYRAFLGIVERRTGDLIRLATGGSGILPARALLPDLVERLTDETCRAARHVLRMCIRAVDYCPPVDVTFGEFLRALVTADVAQVPDDRFGYRVAFLEAFRRYGLLPRSLRTVSVDTLRWREWPHAQPAWLRPAVDALGIDLTRRLDRAEIFHLSEMRRREFGDVLRKQARDAEACQLLGLQFGLGRYTRLNGSPQRGTSFDVDNLRVAKRVRPDGDLSVEVLVVIRQRRSELLAGQDDPRRFWFRGGSTLVIDPFGPDGAAIKFAVLKPITSFERLQRERSFRTGEGGEDASSYFDQGGEAGWAAREPFAVMHATRWSS